MVQREMIVTLVAAHDAHSFYLGQPLAITSLVARRQTATELVQTGVITVDEACELTRYRPTWLRRMWQRLTWWRRTKLVVTKVDTDCGYIKVSPCRWSWWRWRWEAR